MPITANIALQSPLLDEAQALAQQERVPLENVLIRALQVGLADLRSDHFFRARSGRGNVEQALNILKRAGEGNHPLEDDRLSIDLQPEGDQFKPSSTST